MPSFDVVAEVDHHELTNAVDQANRELQTRFDFKDVEAKFELTEKEINLNAPETFQLKQMQDILVQKCAKRKIDIKSLAFGDVETSLSSARQTATIVQGIDQANAKKLTKAVKQSKLKVQAAIMGDKIRVTGKKRDDLQQAIALFKELNLELPLQYQNFRD